VLEVLGFDRLFGFKEVEGEVCDSGEGGLLKHGCFGESGSTA
jgi:hypothetical protein